MSAILGRIHFSGSPVDPHQFATSLTALEDYGREGARSWLQGPVGLGHQHLAISPSSNYDTQPLVQDGYVIVADAILDNRDSLCGQLDIERCLRATLPDSQLILLAYRRWGRECAAHLIGDFAFAIWDRTRESLFCARDHIGARPFFYCHVNDYFLFSTDIRGLLAHQDITFYICEERIASFLLRPFDSRESCFFQGIHHLPPGHWLHIDRARLSQRPHWDPIEAPSIRYPQRDDYLEHYRELLEQAVTDRICTRFPVGSHISGGLDSTGVTILANRHMRHGGRALDRCYSWAPPVSDRYPLAEDSRDERRIIQDVCQTEHISCHFSTTTGRDFHDFLARDIALEGDTDLFEELPIMAHAANRGTRVMLSGWGGDECATYATRGYPSYLLKRGQWLTLLAMARRAAGGIRHSKQLFHYLWQQALLPLMPDAVYARYTPYMRDDELDLFAAPWLLGDFPQLKDQRSPAWREYPDPRRVQVALLVNGHLNSRMTTWAIWAAPHGLIYRYPLTDKRLVNFVLGLPLDLLWHNRTSRGVYRNALRDVLPRQLGKQDPTNEKKRMDIRLACWKLLAEESRQGQFRHPCPWLDVTAMRKRINSVPEAVTSDNVLSFIPLHSTLRIWHLWQRYGEGSNRVKPYSR